MPKANKAELNISEAILQALICQIGPAKFVIALNNVSCHGEVFKGSDWECILDENDTILGAWFEGIEKLEQSIHWLKS